MVKLFIDERLRLQQIESDAYTRRLLFERIEGLVNEPNNQHGIRATAKTDGQSVTIDIRLGEVAVAPTADAPQREAEQRVRTGPRPELRPAAAEPAQKEVPPGPAPAQPETPAPFRSGTYSDQENELFERLAAEGKTSGQIAAALNRSPNSVSVKLAAWRKKQAALSGSIDDLLRHLEDLGNPDPWTVERDMKLVGYMRRDSMGLGSAAALLRINRTKVEARWRALTETDFEFDMQQLTQALAQRFTNGGKPKAATTAADDAKGE